jgi:putative membrane-bound dehydrogenase-like protein
VLFVANAAEQARGEAPAVYHVGVARVDVTPTYPVRLSGFGFRRTESEGVSQRIWAKALAIGKDDPAVLIAVDNLGVPADIVALVAKRLKAKGVRPERVAVTATHTHTAPMLSGTCPTLFGVAIPAEHQKHIDRYTREFTDALEKAALAALADRRPARLSWGVGKVGFAVNRRTRGGPVDHDLPLLVVRDPKGKVRAIYVSYACHCVTLSHNKVGGDWAGHASQAIEDDHQGAVALVSIGCGADSNPNSGVTGDKVEVASRQGLEIAREVKRLLAGYLAPVEGPIVSARRTLDLPLADLPTRAQWEARGQRKDAVGYHARVQLARLDRGDKLRDKILYPVTTWSFGKSLGMVFLPGEVVVDYSLQIKRALDGRRLWINAYSNDAPCYIPSERVLKEGGYEGGGAMVYYDVPGPFRAGLEEKIVAAVKDLLGKPFAPRLDPARTGSSLPLSPQQSLALLRTHKGLLVDLVAAEPLVVSPVAIDFGPDGRLWVAEMIDYPSGVRGDFKPGGRVRVLEDTDGDGIFDKSTIFLDNIPFPTGITVWRKGVLICAAPDILYAEDTRRDGKADVVRKLYSGFGTENYQARVNSLCYGLDGWVHGSCGMFGGRITSHRTGKVIELGHRDFRIRPDTGEIEPATGRTQQGRVRDDRGNWFGCDNSTLCRHYVLPDHYLRRNPHVAFSGTTTLVSNHPDANRLYPASSNLQLFRLSGPPGRVTAACGLGIHRDDRLGREYAGNAFVCEPVNLLVHRLQLSPRGSTFSGRRADSERASEFLASTDNWFRPVQVRTGPDGALWVIDMYRFVIEHPRWIPAEDLARLDVRAGHDLGRIYRVRAAAAPRTALPRLDRLDARGLAAALDTANGTVRDLAGQMLVWGKHESAGPALRKIAGASKHPEARLQALCVLDGLGKLTPEVVQKALADTDAGVRRHAVRLAEPLLAKQPALGEAVVKLVDDSDAQVRLQVAFTLGEWRDTRASRALAKLARQQGHDPALASALLSSLHAGNVAEVTPAVLSAESSPTQLPNRLSPYDPLVRMAGPADGDLVRRLVGLAVILAKRKTLPRGVDRVFTPERWPPHYRPSAGLRVPPYEVWQFVALGGLLEALQQRGDSPADLTDAKARDSIRRMLAEARRLAATDVKADDFGGVFHSSLLRLAAFRVLGCDPASRDADLRVLARLLAPQQPAEVQSAALAVLGRIPGHAVADTLLAGWKGHTPALRGQILALLLSRDAWLRRLLTALEKKEVRPGHLDAARRQRLLGHRDETVRKRAAKVFNSPTSADRQKVLRDHADVAAMKGDSGRGKAVFTRACASCHLLEGVGHAVGPDLSALANRTAAYLLMEILDPNRNVDTRYLQYTAVTKRGRSFTGILAAETATSITLREQEGRQHVLLRADLEQLTSTGKSLMPEGLEKDLTKQDLADLIAYLSAPRRAPKRFAGNNPVTLRVAGGACALLATSAAIYGNEIVFEQPFQNVGCWHGGDDHVVWTVEVEKESTFDVWLDWSCASAVAGNTWVLEGGKGPLRGKVAGTGGWDRYQMHKVGTLTLPAAGTHRLTFRPDGPVRGALLDLRGVHLLPPGTQPGKADATDLAKQLLDDKLAVARRQALIEQNPDLAADLVRALTADLKPGTKEEYRRIPWIWRVAVAAGKRNEAGQLKKLLAVSLPAAGEVLRDWQAVVVGGGIVNGISLKADWPAPRLDELVRDDASLKKRWERARDLASAMADDAKVPTGTRYDALRMIALAGWEKCGAQLTKYLAKGTHDELTMGAISGLSDIDSPRVPGVLLEGLGRFSVGNRKLAVDALLRTDDRTTALLDALQAGKVSRALLSAGQVKALRQHKNQALRARAEKVLGE